jgi:hypothetical protein
LNGSWSADEFGLIGQARFNHFPLNRNVFWSPHQLEPSENELLEHCEQRDHGQHPSDNRLPVSLVGAKTLLTFSPDAVALKNLVIRMALSDNTPSSTAVLHSLLALAQVNRDRRQVQTYKLAASAFRNLATSATTSLNRHEAVQHAVAGMLLGSGHVSTISLAPELHLLSLKILRDRKKSEQWMWYICNAKNLVKAANLDWDVHASDMNTTMSWIYYHDALGKLCLRHWLLRQSGTAAYIRDFHQSPKFCKMMTASPTADWHSIAN